MGVIISKIETWLECDTPGCDMKSQPIMDQTKAVDTALAEGWWKSQTCV